MKATCVRIDRFGVWFATEDKAAWFKQVMIEGIISVGDTGTLEYDEATDTYKFKADGF